MQIVQRKTRWLVLLLILALGLAAVVFQPPCLVRQLLHIPCPACGMTRAWLAALRLELGTAFLLHPMFWAVPVLLAYLLREGRLFRRVFWDRLILGLILAGFAVHYGVVLMG